MILLGSGFTATRGTQPPDVPTPWFSASATDATSRPTPAASITALKSVIVALENLIVAPPFGPVCLRSGRLRPRSFLLSGVSCTPLVAPRPGREGASAPPPKPPRRTLGSRRTTAGWAPRVRGEPPDAFAGTAGAGTPAAFREPFPDRLPGQRLASVRTNETTSQISSS